MAVKQELMQLDSVMTPHTLDATDISDGWYTPPWIIDAARLLFSGAIDTDPATCAAAQAIVQAKVWYTPVENGLLQPWCGNVWLNPPYSKPLPWVEKLLRCYEDREITAALVLTNCSCSPEWARPLWQKADAVCLLAKRINWWHPTKMNANAAYDRDSALFYFGQHHDLFSHIFRAYGAIR